MVDDDARSTVGPLQTTSDVSTQSRRKPGASAPSSEPYPGVERHICMIFFVPCPGMKLRCARRSDAFPASTQEFIEGPWQAAGVLPPESRLNGGLSGLS